MDNLHRDLVDKLLVDPQTPTDHAVKNEIMALRGRVLELEYELEQLKKKPARKTSANKEE